MKAAIPLAAAAAASAFILAGVDSARMPQAAVGDDALSVAFSDAKKTISAAMMRKADSYFHGGIDIECHEEHDHDCRCQTGANVHEAGRADGSLDPWRWINRHVRAPEVHMHLDDGRAVEMLPWFWAAVKADPHNVDAWTTAAYIANRMMKDRPLALDVLREARKKNPDSLELAWTEAGVVYDGGRGDAAAAERMLERARADGKRLCGGRLSSLSGRDAEMYCRILDYLSGIMETRGDRAAIRRLLDEARATGAQTPAVESIAERLRSCAMRQGSGRSGF